MKKIEIALLVPGILGVLSITSVRIVDCVQFDQDIEGHLKRAADANTLELAKKEMETAVTNIHAWKLCTDKDPNWRAQGEHDCYTNILYRVPADDVLFWRTNLEAALADLKSVPKDAGHLTVSNTLMKLRETILDQGKEKVKVTVPPGISVYPHNSLFFWLVVLFGVAAALAGVSFWWREIR